MKQKQKRSPFLKDKPYGTLPSRQHKNSRLLQLTNKMDKTIKMIKQNLD